MMRKATGRAEGRLQPLSSSELVGKHKCWSPEKHKRMRVYVYEREKKRKGVRARMMTETEKVDECMEQVTERKRRSRAPQSRGQPPPFEQSYARRYI